MRNRRFSSHKFLGIKTGTGFDRIFELIGWLPTATFRIFLPLVLVKWGKITEF